MVIVDNIMLRNKYKYAKNWGLLPLRHPPNPTPSVKTYAILEEQTLQQYEMRVDPSKQATFVLYNDREYLHRQCTYLTQHSNSNVASHRVSCCRMWLASTSSECHPSLCSWSMSQSKPNS